MSKQALLALALVGLLSAAPGCGGTSSGGLVPVKGRVTVDGKPLKFGTVSFRPAKDKGNSSDLEPAGEIDEDGNYEVHTQKKEGAPAGWWKVIVSSRDPIDPKDPYKPTKSYVPERNELVDKTDLLIEVVENRTSGYDLSMTTRKK
jgi:hypothetical protein